MAAGGGRVDRQCARCGAVLDPTWETSAPTELAHVPIQIVLAALFVQELYERILSDRAALRLGAPCHTRDSCRASSHGSASRRHSPRSRAPMLPRRLRCR